MEKLKNMTKSVKFQEGMHTFATSAIALIASLVITGIIIAVCGYNPFEIYLTVFGETLSTRSNIALCLSQATPLIFAGMSFAIGLRVGLVNTGVEGQLVAGAFVAALIGVYVPMPDFIHAAVAVMIAAVAGGLVALFTTFIRLKTGAPEVITGIMLNSILTYFASYFINGPLKPEGASVGKTEQIMETAELTRIVPRTQLTTAIIIAVFVGVILHLVLTKTVFGFKIRATGLNLTAARVAGIQSEKVYLATGFIMGAVAGIGGAAVSLGVYRCYIENLSLNYGFGGIPVAALAGYSPIAVPVAGVLFGILKAGTVVLSRSSSAPIEIVSIIQALVVVFVSAPAIVTSVKDWKVFKRKQKTPAEVSGKEGAQNE